MSESTGPSPPRIPQGLGSRERTGGGAGAESRVRASLDTLEKGSGGCCRRAAGKRAWWPRVEVSAAGTPGRTVEQQGRWERSERAGTVVPSGWRAAHLSSESESEVAQSCPTLCDPTDCSLQGSSIHGVFQARVLEWVAISTSRGSFPPRDRTRVSCIVGFTI